MNISQVIRQTFPYGMSMFPNEIYALLIVDSDALEIFFEIPSRTHSVLKAKNEGISNLILDILSGFWACSHENFSKDSQSTIRKAKKSIWIIGLP